LAPGGRDARRGVVGLVVGGGLLVTDWIWLGVVAAVAIATSAAGAALARPRARGAVVLLLGDSLAVGLGSHLPALIRSSGGECHTAARTGTIAGYWTRRLGDLMTRHQPDRVIVSLGTNDTLFPSSGAALAFERDAAELVRMAAPARVVWLVPSWLAYAARIRRGAAASGAELLEAPAGLEVAPDRIHLTPAGYRSWAAHVHRST